MVIIVATTTEEIKEAFAWLSENTGANAIVKAAEIQKQKKAEYDKQRYESKKNSTVKEVNVGREKREEEREEKEAVSPLVPPSLSPDTPYPIPPIIPPSQEKEEREGERKERDSAKSPKPVKNRYGNFGHVLLTADEDNKLCEKFGVKGTDDRIQRLDDYLENNRKKHYDNHYLTILNWARRDEETQPLMMQKPQTTFVKPEPKKTYDFTDVLEMRRQKQEQEVIDL